MKIGPREKWFCFSRGPIFVYVFCKTILLQPLLFPSFPSGAGASSSFAAWYLTSLMFRDTFYLDGFLNC